MDKEDKEKINKENSEEPLVKDNLVETNEIGVELKTEKGKSEIVDDKAIREKIEKTDIDDSLKVQASNHAQSIKLLDEEKKINKLLDLAKSKGVIYAINVAKKMDDPYLLDILHDKLSKDGYYKDFIK